MLLRSIFLLTLLSISKMVSAQSNIVQCILENGESCSVILQSDAIESTNCICRDARGDIIISSGRLNIGEIIPEDDDPLSMVLRGVREQVESMRIPLDATPSEGVEGSARGERIPAPEGERCLDFLNNCEDEDEAADPTPTVTEGPVSQPSQPQPQVEAPAPQPSGFSSILVTANCRARSSITIWQFGQTGWNRLGTMPSGWSGTTCFSNPTTFRLTGSGQSTIVVTSSARCENEDPQRYSCIQSTFRVRVNAEGGTQTVNNL
jgi:hypothetical protein